MPDDIFRFRPQVFELFLLEGLFVSDQIVKMMFLLSNERFVCNPGGAWGSDIPNTTLIALVPIILAGIMLWWIREADPHLRIPLVLLFAGGVGNYTDRILFGCIRDFTLISRFPAFNLADIFLTIGVLFLFYSVFQTKKKLR